jgi:hypothetical protein
MVPDRNAIKADVDTSCKIGDGSLSKATAYMIDAIKELSLDNLDQVSGGRVFTPKGPPVMVVSERHILQYEIREGAQKAANEIQAAIHLF